MPRNSFEKNDFKLWDFLLQLNGVGWCKLSPNMGLLTSARNDQVIAKCGSFQKNKKTKKTHKEQKQSQNENQKNGLKGINANTHVCTHMYTCLHG